MSEPLIFVTTHAVNDGELERITALGSRFAEVVESADTGLVAFHIHLSEDGSEVSNVQVHAGAESMEAYLPLASERIHEALALSRTLRIDVFGTPGPLAREVLRHNREQGVAVRVLPSHLGGFTRAMAAA